MIIPLISNGQSEVRVQGIVTDTTNTGIHGAKVILASINDSLISTTNAEGRFFFKGIKSKTVELTISSLGYNSSAKKHTLEDRESTQILPATILVPSATQLDEVIIRSKVAPFRLMKDSIEFNALAYSVREGDYVADLLRQLPGIQVDKENNVTTLGKQIVKFRVNGKDFFTGDVQEFISRLPSKLVDKLQIIDDYGDNANFTGIKVGEPIKMINLVLKDDINQGTFSDLEASGGTNSRYTANLNGNFWRGDNQISLNGTSNNTSIKAGINRNTNIGFNFQDKLGKKLIFRTGYNYMKGVDILKQDISSKIMSSLGLIDIEANSQEEKRQNSHNLNLSLQSQGTETYISGGLSGRLNSLFSEGATISEQTGIILQSLNTNSKTHINRPFLNGNLTVGHKLNKPGRIISLAISGGITDTKDLQDQKNHIGYYDHVTHLIKKDSINNQAIDSKINSQSVHFTLTYTEPLGRAKTPDIQTDLDFIYSISSSGGNNNRLTKFESPIGILEKIDSLSNENRTYSTTQTFGMNVRHSKKALSYSVGLNVQRINRFSEDDITKFNRSELSIFPTARMTFITSPRNSINIVYSGTPVLPTYDQLQSFPDYRNLQNITIGNPELKSAFNHRVSLSYNNVNKNGLSTLYLNIDATNVQNKIVNRTNLVADTLNSLKQQTRFTNINGNHGLSGNYLWSLSIANWKSNLQIRGDLSYSREIFFTDNIENFNKILNLTQSVGIYTNLSWLRLNTSLNYINTKHAYSLNTMSGNNVKSWMVNSDINTYISKSLRSTVSLLKTINKGYALSNLNPLILDVSLEKSFFKSECIKVIMRANDLFNQGNILQRNVSANLVSESRSNRISRYFLLTLKWELQDFSQKEN